MNQKSLLQLADEYSENISNINFQIEKLRAELFAAQRAHKNILVGSVTRKLTVLYNQRNELTEIERYLRTYYCEETRCAV